MIREKLKFRKHILYKQKEKKNKNLLKIIILMNLKKHKFLKKIPKTKIKKIKRGGESVSYKRRK